MVIYNSKIHSVIYDVAVPLSKEAKNHKDIMTVAIPNISLYGTNESQQVVSGGTITSVGSQPILQRDTNYVTLLLLQNRVFGIKFSKTRGC